MASELVSRVFGTVDARDATTFSKFFTERGRMVFANGEPMFGAEQIEAGVRGFFGSIKALRHTVKNEWLIGAETIVELTVEYDRLDGETVTIPVVSIWQVDERDLIDDYRVFFDLTPVYA